MERNNAVNVGLIGFGMAGQVFHAPVIAAVENLNLQVIQTASAENVQIAKQRYPQTEIVDDAAALLARADIDLIVVATPNHTHFALAKQALQAGKHVVVDKPFTVTAAEAFELIALAEASGKVLTVHQNRRWDADFLTVRKIIEKGLLGRLIEAEIRYDRYRPFLRPNTWKEESLPGTGILYDLGSHLIDQAQTLFGFAPAVTADIRTERRDSKIADSFELRLHYPDLKVTLRAGMLVRELLPRFVLIGEKGMFIKYGMDVQEEALKAGAAPDSNIDWGVEPEAQWGKINTEIDALHFVGKVESAAGDYRCFYQNVRDAVLQNAQLVVTAAQAAQTIKVIESAMQSQKEKQMIEIF